MDFLLQAISALAGDPVTGGWVLVGLTGAAVFTVSLALFLLFGGIFDPVRSRLVRVTNSRTRSQIAGQMIARRVQDMAPSLVAEDNDRSSTKVRLVVAGFRKAGAVQIYHSSRVLLIIGLPIAAFAIASVTPSVSINLAVFAALLATTIAYIAPSFFLDRLIRRRQREIGDSFPDVLDMLVVCCEAGLGLDAALQRVGKELGLSHETLAEELRLVNAEIRAGVGRHDAYRHLAVRTGLPEIRSMVATLTQSMQFGSNVADVLRIYADDFRDKRIQAAEEQAAKLAVKLIFPLVFCFLPAFFIITMGPAVIGLSAALRGIVATN